MSRLVIAIRSLGILLLFGLVCFAGEVTAQLKGNAQYDVSGLWSGGVLRGTAIDPAEADVKPGEVEIEGTITALDLPKKILQIGPVTVEWSDSTHFIGIKPAAFKVGASIEVECRMVAPRRVLATVIERAPAPVETSYLRIVGAVTNVKENADGSVRFEVIGVAVLLPSDVYRGLRSSRAGHEQRMAKKRPELREVFDEYEVERFLTQVTPGF